MLASKPQIEKQMSDSYPKTLKNLFLRKETHLNIFKKCNFLGKVNKIINLRTNFDQNLRNQIK